MSKTVTELNTAAAELIAWLDCCGIESHFVEKVRAKLAEQPAPVQQEPAARLVRWGETMFAPEGYTVNLLDDTLIDGTLFYTTPQAQPAPAAQQEPLAWQDKAKPSELVAAEEWDNIDPQWHWMYHPLFPAPQAQPAREWVGLTEAEKRQLFERVDCQGGRDYINAIESKLKEKNT